MIALSAWAKLNGLSQGAATKLFNAGMLPGAIRDGFFLRISEETPVPAIDQVVCQVCDRSMQTISNTHLKDHSLTVEQYRLLFPNAPIVSKLVSDKISDKATGKIVSKETGAKISAAKKGVSMPTHPRNIPGVWKPDDEARLNMSAAQRKRHETKQPNKH